MAITAKTTLSILKGEKARANAAAVLEKYAASRMARASGDDSAAAGEAAEAAAARVTEALDYAIAAVSVFKSKGKSAVKEYDRLGLGSAEPPTGPESDEDDEFDL